MVFSQPSVTPCSEYMSGMKNCFSKGLSSGPMVNKMHLAGMLMAICDVFGREVDLNVAQEIELLHDLDVANAQVTDAILFVSSLQCVAVVTDTHVGHRVVLSVVQESVLVMGRLRHDLARVNIDWGLFEPGTLWVCISPASCVDIVPRIARNCRTRPVRFQGSHWDVVPAH